MKFEYNMIISLFHKSVIDSCLEIYFVVFKLHWKFYTNIKIIMRKEMYDRYFFADISQIEAKRNFKFTKKANFTLFL